MTKSMRLMRQLAGRQTVIYNDKLVDGRRSLKVIGWTLPQYTIAQRAFELEGLQSKVVTFKVHPHLRWRWRLQPYQSRLHVTE